MAVKNSERNFLDNSLNANRAEKSKQIQVFENSKKNIRYLKLPQKKLRRQLLGASLVLGASITFLIILKQI